MPEKAKIYTDLFEQVIQMKRNEIGRIRSGVTVAIFILCCVPAKLGAQVVRFDPARMPRIGRVDDRFQSYNIEMVEIVGGRFWKPYSTTSENRSEPQLAAESTPTGMDPTLYRYRPPIDLSKSRLRKLATALGPAYVRVSGTWANSVYFHNSDGPPPAKAPTGFNSVLTRRQWKGVIDFSHAVNAEIVTSFATSPGTRGRTGVWTPNQAREWLAYTKSVGGRIAAAEFMNEPTYAAMGGAPPGYDAAAYGRDIAVFRPFIKKTAPEMLFLGPGSVAEGPFAMAMGSVLKTEDLLKETGPVFDVFSYHLYAAASKRCASMVSGLQTTAESALSQEWLSRPAKIHGFYAGLRDQFEPGKSLWITETADAACGGNPWASTFLDSFRYLDQLGLLAKLGVRVIMHNTLAASDYGLLDENTFEPRPNYWAALLWRRLMGATVLDPGPSSAPAFHIYAHCLRGQSRGVALLFINTGRSEAQTVGLTTEAERYELTAGKLLDRRVRLNASELKLGDGDAVPQLRGTPVSPGKVTFAPASISFITIPKANNMSCP